MTNKQYENGEYLNIHNATKEQLKFMVKDRDETIKRLQKELNEKQAALNEAIEMLKNCIWNKSFRLKMEEIMKGRYSNGGFNTFV